MSKLPYNLENFEKQMNLVKKYCEVNTKYPKNTIEKIISQPAKYGIWPITGYIEFLAEAKDIKSPMLKKLLDFPIQEKKKTEKWINQFARDVGNGIHSYKFTPDHAEEIGCSMVEIIPALNEIKKFLPFVEMKNEYNKMTGTIHVTARYLQ